MIFKEHLCMAANTMAVITLFAYTQTDILHSPMNVHPIFVHFPIALLTIYTFLEITRMRFLTKQLWWEPVKSAFLLFGFLGGIAAYQTGEWSEEVYRNTTTMPLVEMHSTFAFFTMIVYGVLAALYAIDILEKVGASTYVKGGLHSTWKMLLRIHSALFTAPILIIGSIAGFILITMAGALGGAIVYGPNVDPVVSVVYHLFFTK